MATQQLITWKDDRIVDDEAVPARPWSMVVGLVLVLLLAELVLSGLAPGDADDRTPGDRGEARALLRRAHDDPAQPWLLLGDSVLAGTVMRGKVDDWRSHRVIDYLRAEQSPQSPARFHQLALDAMLPLDMVGVVRELDAFDPEARVAVAIELNPRYFSGSYAASDAACTRPWLCELGPRLRLPGGGPDWPAWLRWVSSLAYDDLVARVPVLRHRGWAGTELRPALGRWLAPMLTPSARAEEPDPLAARARVREHYVSLALGDDARQIQALVELVEALRRSGRRAVFFTTPLEDGFVASAMDPDEYGAYIARMSEIVEGSGGREVTLVNLDHPLFARELFLDHCHLGPAGNRRLAIDLLVELGLGVAQTPAPDTLAHWDGPDVTLVSRVDRGFGQGAAWQAMFDQPHGIAVAPGAERIVIADTGNHVLRELSGALQTVRVLAGVPGEAGREDGPAGQALLNQPFDPVLLGGRVYFADGRGRRLRVLDRGVVSTLRRRGGPAWRGIRAVVGDGQRLLLLDGSSKVLAFDPLTRRTRTVARATDGLQIVAIAPTPDGRLFIADDQARIWVGRGHGMVLGDEPQGVRLEFDNRADPPIPQVRGWYFPFGYDRMGLSKVAGMTWVERYDALLVMDDVPPKKRTTGLTERIHLRLFDTERDRIYPWLKPLVHGGGYALANQRSGSFVSYFHEGTMAMDQQTATVFWLERSRSRLFYFADGLWGAARVGHIRDLRARGFRDLLGVASGTATLAQMRPDRWIDRRLGPWPRTGPYVGLVIGSSMLSKSDIIGSYSFGVRLELGLRASLGYRDGIGFDVVQRSYPGVRSETVLQELRSTLDDGLQLDVLLVELGGRHRGFFLEDPSEERMRTILAELDALARRHDTLVVFFDDSALVSSKRDGLRPPAPVYEQFKEMAESAGFLVVDLSDDLLRHALERSPFGSPPWRSHHAAPWAIDAAADLLAERLYPPLREHLRGRVPALWHGPVTEDAPLDALAGAFTDVNADWAEQLPPLGGEAIQSVLREDQLEVFVDLARVEPTIDPADEAALAHVAARVLHETIAVDPVGGRARRVELRLATFSRYDEYGAGVRDAAEVVFERSLDRDGLAALLREQLAGP